MKDFVTNDGLDYAKVGDLIGVSESAVFEMTSSLEPLYIRKGKYIVYSDGDGGLAVFEKGSDIFEEMEGFSIYQDSKYVEYNAYVMHKIIEEFYK